MPKATDVQLQQLDGGGLLRVTDQERGGPVEHIIDAHWLTPRQRPPDLEAMGIPEVTPAPSPKSQKSGRRGVVE